MSIRQFFSLIALAVILLTIASFSPVVMEGLFKILGGENLVLTLFRIALIVFCIFALLIVLFWVVDDDTYSNKLKSLEHKLVDAEYALKDATDTSEKIKNKLAHASFFIQEISSEEEVISFLKRLALIYRDALKKSEENPVGPARNIRQKVLTKCQESLDNMLTVAVDAGFVDEDCTIADFFSREEDEKEEVPQGERRVLSPHTGEGGT